MQKGKSKPSSTKKDLKNTISGKITELVDSISHEKVKDSKVKKSIKKATKVISKALAKDLNTASKKKTTKPAKTTVKSKSIVIPKENLKKITATKSVQATENIKPNIVAIKTAKIAEKKVSPAKAKKPAVETKKGK